MNVKKAILWRVWFSFGLVFVLACAIVGKIAHTQTVRGAYWRSLADSISTKWVNIEPIRGNIYASDGSLLATSIPIYQAHLDVNAKTIKKEDWDAGVDSLAWCLSNFFKDKSTEQYLSELKRSRRRGSRYHLIKRRLNHNQLKELKTFPILRLGRYKGGLIVQQKSRRILPFQLAQRTIGYKTPDVKPVGLEGAYDRYLQGSLGKRLMQKVSGGVWIPLNAENELEPKDGQDIITNIDVNFQDVTSHALLKALQTHGADHGCAVVMEVKTGQIKAIANLSRESESSDIYIEKYNYAIGESTEPGSTFKLVTTMAMLEDGKITPNTTVDTRGGETTFFDRVMRDSKEGGYGVVTLQKAFEQSSNVAMSTLAYQAFSKSPSKFTNYISHLRLNQPLGLTIRGEGAPVFKAPRDKDWNGTTLPWMSIGYELQMTPLQTLTLYNAVANNGVMVKPQFVREVREVGKVVQAFDTEVLVPEICSPSTLKSVQKMLEGVVETGTATNIRNEMYKSAGKTGTAQVANEKGAYKEQRLYQASFAGYFPTSQPLYSIIVVIANPSKGIYYGASVAAPVFKEIADKIYSSTATTRSYLSYFGKRQESVPPMNAVLHNDDLETILKSNGKNPAGLDSLGTWVRPTTPEGRLRPRNFAYRKGLVPDVKGMTLADALYLLENLDLHVKFSGKGRVTTQSLNPGQKYLSQETITLQLN